MSRRRDNRNPCLKLHEWHNLLQSVSSVCLTDRVNGVFKPGQKTFSWLLWLGYSKVSVNVIPVLFILECLCPQIKFSLTLSKTLNHHHHFTTDHINSIRTCPHITRWIDISHNPRTAHHSPTFVPHEAPQRWGGRTDGRTTQVVQKRLCNKSNLALHHVPRHPLPNGIAEQTTTGQ